MKKENPKTCRWCPPRINFKGGKPYILARGIGDWEFMCKRCYGQRKDNAFFKFKPLKENP